MEDFIFDDDVDEVGAEVEAFCPKCKADTTHVVISKYEDEIRPVQCNPCGDVHSYPKPKGEKAAGGPGGKNRTPVKGAKAAVATAKQKAEAKLKTKAPPKKVKRAARAAAPVRNKAKAKKAAPKKKAAGKKR